MWNTIIATIKPFKFEGRVSEVGASGMIVIEIKGFYVWSGNTETYSRAEYTVNFIPKIKLEIGVTTKMADQVAEAISKATHTVKLEMGRFFWSWKGDVSATAKQTKRRYDAKLAS